MSRSLIELSPYAGRHLLAQPSRPVQRARAWWGELRRDWGRALQRLPVQRVLLQEEGVLGLAPESTQTKRYASLAAWCEDGHADSDVRLLLGGELVHSLLCDPKLPLQDIEDVRGYARHQFSHYHGAAARAWPIALWSQETDGPRAAGSRQGHTQWGACALHGVDLDALKAVAAQHRVRLRNVVPLWSLALRHAAARVPGVQSAPQAAVALVEGSLVTWLRFQRGSLIQLQQRYLNSPCVADLNELLLSLMQEGGPMGAAGDEAPVLLGWGIADAGVTASIPVRLLSPLHLTCEQADWLWPECETGTGAAP